MVKEVEETKAEGGRREAGGRRRDGKWSRKSWVVSGEQTVKRTAKRKSFLQSRCHLAPLTDKRKGLRADSLTLEKMTKMTKVTKMTRPRRRKFGVVSRTS